MKKLMTMLAILIVFAAASVSAQVPSPFSFYAGGAVSLPQSPDGFKDGFKTGYHGSLGVGYKVMPSLQVVGKLEYHTFNVNFDNMENMDGYSGGTNKMWMYGLDARYQMSLPAAPISPYFLGGVGFANIKQSEFDGPTPLVTSLLNEFISESTTEMYWNIGAGVNLSSGPGFSIFAQARYVSIATEGEASTFVPITLGLKFF
ncbi:MAG: porin family protein [bacterium]|nr:porin family protein [bacterium]